MEEVKTFLNDPTHAKICGRCGMRFGQHRNGDDACPPWPGMVKADGIMAGKPDAPRSVSPEPHAVDPTYARSSEVFRGQVGGDHYSRLGDFQPWKVFKHWMTPEELKGFMKGTVIVYLAREERKGGRQDIEKAKHTIELYLELTRKEESE